MEEIRIKCSVCGKPVSTPVPEGTLVRAFIQCPDCVVKEINADSFASLVMVLVALVAILVLTGNAARLLQLLS